MDDFAASDGVPSDQSSDHYSDGEMVGKGRPQNDKNGQETVLTGKFNVKDAHDEDTNDREASSKLCGPLKSVDVGESPVAVEQSGSEDSSTTKLLIEQVNALHEQSNDPTEAETKLIHDKIERKKVKALELIQAKERLIKQEKHKFKQEERRRQVDALAQIALRMDVATEISEAKTDIKQGLENEMKTLQQVYPALLGANPVQMQGGVLATGTQQTHQTLKSPDEIKIADYLSQSRESESPFAFEAEAGHGKEDDYEDSFEVEQSAPDIGSDDDKIAAEVEYESFEDSDAIPSGEKVESASNVSAIIAEEEGEIASDAERHGEPERNEVESEIQSDNDGISDDVQFDVPADGNKLESEIEDEEERGGGYEDEYEDESFDDAQSASFTSGVDHVKSEQCNEKEEKSDDARADALSGDAYSDESFEKSSGSPSAQSSEHTAEINVVDDIVPQIENTDANLGQEEQQLEHASIGDLSTALDVIASQFHPLPSNAEGKQAVSIEKDLSIDESNVCPCASVANLSGSTSQEEILSKSIEEQTKRLEELKQMILSRKDELVAVQKDMRIERRREQLSAEEKFLWDEMERVEASLRLDEAALELTRQQNRLESMRLKAKHSEYKTQSKTNINTDLLEGFAYIETAEMPIAEAETVLPKESSKKNTVWGAMSDMNCQTDGTLVECDGDLGLLSGYAHVEDAEVSNFQILSVELCPVAGSDDIDETMPYSAPPAILDEPDRPDVIEREANDTATDVGDNVMGNHELDAYGASQTGDAIDLLDGYAYIEDALQVVESEENLLAGFDHVEDADVSGVAGPNILQSNVESLASNAAADLAAHEEENAFGEDAMAIDAETPTDDENHSTLADPFEASKGDRDCVQVQSEDDSDITQSTLQCQDEDKTKDPGLETALQEMESNANVGRRASEDLVDCITDAIYTKLFDSVVRDASSLSYILPSRRNLGESASPEVVISRTSGEGRNARAASKEHMRETEHTRNLAPQEQRDNFSDASTSERKSVEASEYDSKVEDACCDRIVDKMFADLYNSVVDSEVQIFRKQHMSRQTEPMRSHSNDSDSNSSETSTPSTPEVAKISHMEIATVKKKYESEISAERDSVGKIIEALDIQAGKISLIMRIERNDNSHLKSSRLLYEVVQEIAGGLLFRQQCAAAHSDATGSGLLAAEFVHHVDVVELRQQVEVEMDRILSIRATGKDELARQAQNLTEEMDSGQVTCEERQMMQTQFRTSASHLADRVRLNVIASGTEAATPATRGGATEMRMPRSFYPRTPIPTSRPTSRRPMLLHALFYNESTQLQDRITNFILDDLLQPDELGLER